MSVIVFILKIIGIILLILIGMIAVMLLLVLFVPVHYRVSGEAEEEIAVTAKITWLLSLISFAVDYKTGEVKTALHILGIRKKSKQGYVSEETGEYMPEEKPEEEKAPELAEEIEPQKQTVPKEKLKSETPDFLKRFRMHLRSFWDAGHRVKAAVSQIGKKLCDIRKILTDESNRSVLGAILAEFGYLFRHFKFRRLITDLRFSMGDPSMTGQILGALCVFPFLYRYQVGIIPDFESDELYIKGTFDIKGYMRPVHLIIALVHLWRKKETRILIQKLLDK